MERGCQQYVRTLADRLGTSAINFYGTSFITDSAGEVVQQSMQQIWTALL